MDDIERNFRPKTPTEQRIEARFGRPADAVVRDLYVNSAMTQVQVAEVLGVNRIWVIEFMARSGIPTRDRRALSPEPAPVPQEARP